MSDKVWIAVKVCLPENYREVIVYDEDADKIMIAQYHTLTKTWTGDGLKDNGEHIIYWAPIPAFDF